MVFRIVRMFMIVDYELMNMGFKVVMPISKEAEF